MRNKIKWFDIIFLIIFIISFFYLVSISVKLMFNYITLTYVGFFYVIGVILIFILSGDYIIDKIVFMLKYED